jgi:hypothetical protein
MTTPHSKMMVEIIKKYQKPELSIWASSLEVLQETLAQFEFESAGLKVADEDLADFAQQMLKFMGMWAGSAKRELATKGVAESKSEDLVALNVESGLGVMSCRFQLIHEFLSLDNEYRFMEYPGRFVSEEYAQVLAKFRSRYSNFIAKFMDEEFNHSTVSRPDGLQPALDRILGDVIFEGFTKLFSDEPVNLGRIAGYSHYSAKLMKYWGEDEPFRDAAKGRGDYE